MSTLTTEANVKLVEQQGHYLVQGEHEELYRIPKAKIRTAYRVDRPETSQASAWAIDPFTRVYGSSLSGSGAWVLELYGYPRRVVVFAQR